MIVYPATPHTYKICMDLFLALANYGGGYVWNTKEGIEQMDLFLADFSTPFGGVTQKQAMADIYLAGAATGNNAYIYKDGNKDAIMDLYLAGGQSRPFVFEEKDRVYVLESFYYIADWMLPYIKDVWHFMLDSGAFTFMNDKKNAEGVDWNDYVERYAKFIIDNDIDLFFELDIDSVVGLKEVERLRAKLHELTGKKSIPVWHRSRGLEYWKKITEDYDYVAIGGIVTNEIKRNEYDVFLPLLEIAKANNCKVHGLGFTNMKGLRKYKFDSVDSTAWIYGNRGGFLYHFNGREIVKIDKPDGARMKSKEVAVHNFKEWVKFQKYAKDNL